MNALVELRDTVTGAASSGEGERFRLRARWPSVAQLEYVQKFSTAALLSLGLLMLLGYAVKSPTGAIHLIAGTAKRRAGL